MIDNVVINFLNFSYRIHYHSEGDDVINLQNGAADDKETISGSNSLNASRNSRDRSLLDSDMATLSCYPPEVPNHLPPIINLSKNEDSSTHLECAVDSAVNDDYKENADEMNNLPMDLSKGRKTLSTTSTSNGVDVDAMLNFCGNGSVQPTDENTVERLQEELRDEETKLVLLKKIRQSQQLHHLIKDCVDSAKPVGGVKSQAIPGPPPLIRGVQAVSSTHRTSHHSGEPSHLLPPHASHQQPQQHSHGPPPLIVPSRSTASSVPISVAKSAHSVNPPAVPASANSVSQNYRSPQVSAHSQNSLALPPPAAAVQQEQTPAQRQAAAKLALRKQLEKTLLQIPPPKPPPPEMNFIPNVGNGDFVTLLGLEEAVKCILDNDASARGESVSEVKYVFNPFQCVQCHTDFTPVWKRDKPGSKNVICERCVTNNQKWVLKQEHTNRLKSAFVKALQQEQEIEQTLLAQCAISATSPHLVNSSSSHSTPLVPKNLSGSQRSTLESPHQSSRHHRQHHQQQQQQPQRHSTLWTPPTLSSIVGLSQAFDPRLMFPFHRPPVTSKSPVDIQRQYLLDLIPRRSHLDGPVLWRT